MRQLGVVEFVTLDGVMQGLAGSDEDRDEGFAYGGWGAPMATRCWRPELDQGSARPRRISSAVAPISTWRPTGRTSPMTTRSPPA